jgi:hypothetical protein
MAVAERGIPVISCPLSRNEERNFELFSNEERNFELFSL